MPKLSKWREDNYYYFSGKASELSRQLSFAGIAIVWIFKTGEGIDIRLEKKLLLPLFIFVISLSLDFLHYVWGTIIWGYFHRREEKKRKNKNHDPIVDAPEWYNRPTITFFTLKLIAVAIGYFFLFKYLTHLLFK